jgi:CheY-like chemotaxis protein
LEKIKILIADNSLSRTDLIINEIVRSSFRFKFSHVTSIDALIEEVEGSVWDIIITNYSIDGWTAVDTLKYLKDKNLNPRVIVTAHTLEDDAGAECIKRGAADYIPFNKISRISKSIQDAFAFTKINRGLSALTLAEFKENFFSLYGKVPIPVIIYEENSLRIIEINKAAERYFRYSRKDILEPAFQGKDNNMIKYIPRITFGINYINSWKHFRKDGSIIDSEIKSQTLHLSDAKIRIAVVKDMSDKRLNLESLRFRVN